MATKKKVKKVKQEGSSDLSRIRSKLGRLTHERKPTGFMDLGEDLNSVLGDPDRGLAWGKIVEIAGMPSNGKTVIAIDIAASAQAQEAHVIWNDFENSFDQPIEPNGTDWYSRRGLICHRGDPKRGIKPADNFTLIQPYVGRFGKEKEDRLVTAEELIEECEGVMAAVHRKKPGKPILIITDSVTAMLPDEEAVAGLTGQNMRTNMALPFFMGKLLRRWTALLQNFDASAIFINQLRTNPAAYFGDGSYTPGGNALPFYAHVRIRMKRIGKGGRMLKNGKLIGIKGLLINYKNKAGGVEGLKVGYKIFNSGKSRFMEASVIEKEAKA